MSVSAQSASGSVSSLINAWETLNACRVDPVYFETYDRDKYRYTNNWTNMRLADGVMERDGFKMPYKVRGVYEGRKNKQMTRLAIDLAGGPGSAITSQWQANNSPELYRVAVANWRGVGDTAPIGSLENNSTDKLVEDINALRLAASMGRDERVVIRGGSWGMTMATAFAAAYPEKVAGLVLGLPFLARRADIAHNYGAEGALAKRLPQEYDRYVSATGKTDAKEGLQQLADEMGSNDPRRVVAAFIAATRWEYARNGEVFDRTMDNVNPGDPEDRQLIARARIMAHYSANSFFMGKNGVRSQLQSIGKTDIPVVVIANREDPLCESETLNMVIEALPKAEIQVYDANWHWLAKENEDPARGLDNGFVTNGYAYGMSKVGLALRGDTNLNPGVHMHKRRNTLGL